MEDKIKKTLRYSILDGSFYSSMLGFGESFISAFAVFLKANNIHLSLLESLPRTLGSISQLFSTKLLEVFGSRKKLVMLFALLQGLMFIPVALAFFLGTFTIPVLILFVCLYQIFGMLVSPAWNSWMGDLVPENERGVYFGKRNKIAGFVSFSTMLAAGYILQRFAEKEIAYIGFIVIFSIALVSRIISFIYLSKKFEPNFIVTAQSKFTLLDFIKRARFTNYGLFVYYLCFMNFAVFIAAPFFTPYMLRDLNFSYATFTLVTATSLAVKFLTMPLWGKLSDRYGTKKILVVSGFLMPFNPLLWVLSTKLWILILVQAYNGFMWAGFELSSFNFIFDATSSEKRATCVAYFNVLSGIAILIGALAGGYVVRYNNLFWTKYYLVFIISFALRFMASLYFIPKLREVRVVEDISYRKLFFKLIPATGSLYDFIPLETVTRLHKLIKRHWPPKK